MSNYFSLLRIVPFLITSVSLGNDGTRFKIVNGMLWPCMSVSKQGRQFL